MRLVLPRFLVFMLAAACWAAGARAADPQTYKVELVSTGNGAMDSTLHATSDLVSLRTSAPVGPYGLIARARSDIDRLKTVLESYGYYQSGVNVLIDGAALNAPGLADQLMALPKKQDAKIQVKFTLGPLYHLRHITIDGELPATRPGCAPLEKRRPRGGGHRAGGGGQAALRAGGTGLRIRQGGRARGLRGQDRSGARCDLPRRSGRQDAHRRNQVPWAQAGP